MTASGTPNLFISYAREDIEYAKALFGYLKPLILSKKLNVFFDTESIEKGTSWIKEIEGQLQHADAYIFLISRHYFDSNFVVSKELPQMIRGYRDENKRCWPFCLSSYPWEDFEFEGVRLSSIQALGPFNQQEQLVPLNSLNQHQQEAQLRCVYDEIRAWIVNQEKEKKELDKARELEKETKASQAEDNTRPIVVSTENAQSVKENKGSKRLKSEILKPEKQSKIPTLNSKIKHNNISHFFGKYFIVGLLVLGIGIGFYLNERQKEIKLEKQRVALEQARRSELETQISIMSTGEILESPHILEYVLTDTKAIFSIHCASCHGYNGKGKPDFPNLADHDWIYGGNIETIQQTITMGRKGIMTAHGKILSDAEIDSLAKAIQAGDPTSEPNFTQKGCIACHGMDGKGMAILGSANLTDGIYRFTPAEGESVLDSIKYTIKYGVNDATEQKTREAVMPAFGDRLSKDDIKKLAVYVHQLGGVQ